jgi:DNA-binding MarR family transcriptional regulator
MTKPRAIEEFATLEADKRKPVRFVELPGESGDLATLLRQAAAVQRLAEERLLGDLGITPPQLAVLQFLGAYPGLLAADIARRVKLTPQTISLIVANLRRAGLVREEESAVPSSTRARRLALTGQGETILRLGRERIEAESARLLEGMRPKRERALRRWLAGVAAGAPQPGGGLDADDL